MKVGIGITTYNRKEILEKTLEQFKKYTPIDFQIFINDDSETHNGVAKSKNKCIEALIDNNDYIFLFDDDAYPKCENWWIPFIEKSNKYNNHHFAVSTTGYPTCHYWIGGIDNDIEFYNNTCGYCLFYTKKALERVGGMNIEFGIYGNEHSGHSSRIHVNDLSLGFYVGFSKAKDLIYSMDYNNEVERSVYLTETPDWKIELLKEEQTKLRWLPFKKDNFVITSLFCSVKDPQRGYSWEPEIDKYLRNWIDDVRKHNMQCIIFYDNLPKEDILKECDKNVHFIQVDSPNMNLYHYRWIVYNNFLSKYGYYCNRVIFTDCSDVRILENPFKSPDFDDSKIYIGCEEKITDNDWMQWEITRCRELKPYVYMRAKEKMLNAGLLGGHYKQVRNIVRDMSDLSNKPHLKGQADDMTTLSAVSINYDNIVTGKPFHTHYRSFSTEGAWFAHK